MRPTKSRESWSARPWPGRRCATWFLLRGVLVHGSVANPNLCLRACALQIEQRLDNVSTLGIFRVRNFFHHWVVVARIMTMHGLHLRAGRHRQRDRCVAWLHVMPLLFLRFQADTKLLTHYCVRHTCSYLQGIVKENKRLYGEWETTVLTFDSARGLQEFVQEQKILRYQIAEYKYVPQIVCASPFAFGTRRDSNCVAKACN